LREDEPMKESKRKEILKIAKGHVDNLVKMPVPDVDFK
jgi:Asp-tRNA(Asn)/Glu-tRNA(Gln) amidotransferase C subunit